MAKKPLNPTILEYCRQNPKAGRDTLHKVFGISTRQARYHLAAAKNEPEKVKPIEVKLKKSTNKHGETVYVQTSTILIDIQEMKDKSPMDLMRAHGYDPLKWELIDSTNRPYQGTSKLHGTYTMFSNSIKVRPLQTRITTEEIRQIFNTFNPPKLQKIQPVKDTQKNIMLEFGLVDMHLGLLSWKEETGENYDINIAIQTAKDHILDILGRVEPCEKILLPVGQDFFHIDSEKNQTTAGTDQDVDGRWQKIFRKGCELKVWFISQLLQKSNNIEIHYVKSNHDMKMAYFLTLWLDAYYRNESRVNVDIAWNQRKYIKWGKCAICLLHDLPKNKIDKIMQAEEAKLWGSTIYRENHKAHDHHEEVKEYMGVTVRTISPITARSEWTASKGYYSQRRFMAFQWHKEKGLRNILYSNV
jgi:hypothetical protein